MMSGSENRLNLVLRKKQLSDEQFQKFVAAARKVAVFDPEAKLWKISTEKLLLLGETELARVMDELVNLCALTSDEAEKVLRAWRELRRRTVIVDRRSLELRGDENILRTVASITPSYIVIENGFPKLKSVMLIDDFASQVFQKLGVRVVYDSQLKKVSLERRGGRLYWRFNVMDNLLISKLSELGSLKYYVERVILSPEGEYEGSELVERSLRAFRIIEHERTLVTPVGLLQKYSEALAAWGFEVENRVEELPSLQIPFEKKFELLPHQQEAFSAWLRSKRGSIAIFTRGGKSFIALEAIYRLRKPTLILVTTRELMQTWASYLENYLGLPRYFLGFVGGGEKKISGVTIATYVSAVKFISDLLGRFELVIFDEAHHVPASTFKNIALKIDALYRMALSATPRRRDGNEILLYELCGGLVYNLSYEDLVTLKVVAPIERFETFFAKGSEEKLSILVKLLREYSNSKALVFTQYLKTAEEVYSRLLKEGFSVEIITGSTPEGRRELAFKRFLEGRVKVLVTTTVLDEGVTVPDAEVAVLYEGTGEARQMIQRIGRVLGYYPGKTAKVFEIVDVTNPREKAAYFNRNWVKELYTVKRDRSRGTSEGQLRVDRFLSYGD
ncbi:MAG: DEAD/DEAH box helicase [Thermofilum sp.]